jgi:mycothiol synthase
VSITLRPLDKSDIPALAALHAACEAVDDTGEHYNEADLEEEFDNPEIELGLDIVGAYDGDDLVGYFSVMARKDDSDRKAYGFGLTRPDRRGQGIGTLLADAMVARATDVAGDAPMRLLVSGVATNDAQAALLAAADMVPERWSFGMRVTLGAVPPAPSLPEGYSLRIYDDKDADRWLTAHNVAFLDHPNFSVWDASEWQQWVIGSRNFRPALSFFVTPTGEPDTITAYVQTNEFDAYQQATGRREAYVTKVGTLPDHRGKGLATLLLRHCLMAYQEAGYDEASLDVDSLNPTGALGIYERAGFSTERKYATYQRTLGS